MQRSKAKPRQRTGQANPVSDQLEPKPKLGRLRQDMSQAEYARRLTVDHVQMARAVARDEIMPLDNGLIDVR